MYPKAFIYQNNLDLISRYTLDYPNIETGGELFGFWTHTGFPVVQVVTGPGEKVERSPVFFRQDAEYMVKVHRFVNSRHGMQHLGSWHSHHKMDLARPSGYDVQTVQKTMQSLNLGKLFIAITNIRSDQTEINGFLFVKDIPSEYINTPWIVMEGENPFANDEFNSILLPPSRQSPAHNSEAITSKQTATRLKLKTKSPWIHDERRSKVLAEIASVLTSITSNLKLSLSEEDDIIASFEHQGRNLKWRFGDNIHLFSQTGDGLTEILTDLSWIHSLVNRRKALSESNRKKIQNHIKKTIQTIER